jgi:hypothetical protein
MLASENGIRESHSGLKYGRIDIRNRKLTKVCLMARIASLRRKYCRVGSGEDKRVTLARIDPRMCARPDRPFQVLWRRQILSPDGLAAAESRFAFLDEGANRFLMVDCSGCPNQILGFLIH